MRNLLNKIIGDIGEKKEWRATEARAKKLPHDYLVVYNEIKQYIWRGAGPASIDIFKSLLDLFEESAANGKAVLEITGDNVAAFCDELLRDEKTYFETLRERLNRDIAIKLKK
ncbi:MAG: DUF1048 domain-containing protein [bacterium]|nr:DUF1048 domain-containing protein [bacterium]